MGACLLDSELVSSKSINFQNVGSNDCKPCTEKACNSSAEKLSITEIFSQFFSSGIEGLQVSLLSVLFMMSGLILFICGLFGGHLYQFVMAFFFLASGFILDDVREQYLLRK